jgi:protein-disulfide isomerase
MFGRLKSVLDVLATVLVILAASAVLWRWFQPAQPGGRPPVETVEGLSIEAGKVAHMRGTGQVVLVEFADYECPFCARHARDTAPEIHKELIESGTIRHAFLNFPLPIHPSAQKAAEAAECAARQDRFWEMHERLFENERALAMADLSERASRLGLDQARFIECLNTGQTAAKVQADLAEGRRLGVNSTPAFFVGTLGSNGAITLVKRITGAVPFDQFETTVRELLPKQRALR